MLTTPVFRVPQTTAPDRDPAPTTPQGSRLPTATQKRAHEPLLPALWSLDALTPHLPFPFPTPPDLPPSPKPRYRSHYRPPDPATLPADLSGLTAFELAAHLIDFSPLEPELAQMYRPSAKGQVPFHPVSMILAVCLRHETTRGWRGLATVLAGENGHGWRNLCGFADGVTPSASGLRHFFQRVGPAFFAELCPRVTDLLRQHHLFPEQSTFPGDPADRGVSVTQDGMLHPARSRPRCPRATDACYQPLPPPALPPDDAPPESAPARFLSTDDTLPRAAESSGRPCRARITQRDGCACDTPACAQRCWRASVLDAQARFIHYAGHNGKHAKPPDASAARTDQHTHRTGTNVFGYRSVADRVLDDRFAVAWTVQSHLYPANTDERSIFADRLDRLTTRFPDLAIGEWLDDAAVGYGECLNALWDLGALRMVAIRADRGDDDPEICLRRGYDGQGCPLCVHGYRMRSNGYDAARRRHKYVCAQACRREPRRENEPVAPVAECPYLEADHPLGQVVNVGRSFADGSVRLAREIPYGSPTWKTRYGRRNLSESRNGQMEGLRLKRMRSYGLERNTKEVHIADFLVNLHTLGRLVREATKRQTS